MRRDNPTGRARESNIHALAIYMDRSGSFIRYDSFGDCEISQRTVMNNSGWINNSLNDHCARMVESSKYNAFHQRWIVGGIVSHLTSFGKRLKANWLQLDTVLGISHERNLLPRSHAPHRVFQDNDLYGQPVYYQRGEFAHQHGEPTVTGYADNLGAQKGRVLYLKALDTFMMF